MGVKEYKTDEVFGLNRSTKVNYVIRKEVDNKFIDNLGEEKHLIVYGSSKQGKTSLRNNTLQKDDFILIQCTDALKIEDIHKNILMQANIEVSDSKTKKSTKKNIVNVKFSKGLFGLVKADLGGEKETDNSVEYTLKSLEINLKDPNHVVDALNRSKFQKYIVLEDFHYLEEKTQKQFTNILKAFHELNQKLVFIIVGVWLEENRLSKFNGDLTGRLNSINADHWTNEELLSVIENGEKLLNIKFSSEFKSELINNCFGSVYLVQMVCNKVCKTERIFISQNEKKEFQSSIKAHPFLKEISQEQNARYKTFLRQFALGITKGRKKTINHMYYWILFALLTSEINEIEKGLRLIHIRQKVQAKHPNGIKLTQRDFTHALEAIKNLQLQMEIRPTVLDYNEAKSSLHIIDKTFLLWLSYQNSIELLEDLHSLFYN